MIRFGLVLGLAALAAFGFGETTGGAKLQWYKGNTHTHTTNSDGDSTPGLVARWYANNGYDFLFLTDHNVLTEVTELQREIAGERMADKQKPFLLIPGEEVSYTTRTAEQLRYALHTCALDNKTTVGKPKDTGTKLEILQQSIDSIVAAGGVPSVNHPNFMWSLTADDLFAMKNLKHFEIYNGHPSVNNAGGGGVPGTEAMWDNLLSRGRNYFGVAVDDAHHYKIFRQDQANPGRAWVTVRAAELSPTAIIKSLSEGEFYASTGVELDDLAATPGQGLRLKIRQKRDSKYRTEFVGKDGKVLASDESMEPTYQLKPGDLYVRARVLGSNGDFAWTQAVWGKQ